ncbi:MAG: dUTP diphosphatase [Candidatus Thorarchaeota archaeon]
MDNQIVVKVKRLVPEGELPRQAKEGDAAFDLFSVVEYIIQPGETYGVPTGIALEIPQGYEGQVRPRSGLALKNGITITNSPGTIDSGYRGEVKIIIHNLGKDAFSITRGMRIAQIAIRPVPEVRFVEVADLEDSERGAGGFGSTGT